MDYTPGLVAASLNQGKKKKKNNSENNVNPVLAELFSTNKAPATKNKKKKNEKKKKQKDTDKPLLPVENGTHSTEVKAKTGKAGNKRKATAEVETESQATVTPPAPKFKKEKKASNPAGSKAVAVQPSNNFPYVHESLLSKKGTPKQNKNTPNPTTKSPKAKQTKKKEDREEGLPPSRKRNKRVKTADKRTIFIGNCPLSTDKKAIMKMFKGYGAIESLRFRCGPAAKLEVPRRAVIITKDFHEKARSYVCYLVFKEEESAEKALEMNGHVLEGLHLRVDLASNHKKHDKKRSVFVGNLDFATMEEDLRTHFQDCGAINNVRVIRDRQTSLGKGIAYIQFENKDSVLLARQLNETELQGRRLRVMACTNKPTDPKASAHKTKGHGRTAPFSKSTPGQPPERKKQIGFAPSNRKTSSKSFHDILQSKKEKRLKKKKDVGNRKSDGLSSIFGDMTADEKQLKMDNPKLQAKAKASRKPFKGGKSKKDAKGGKKEKKEKSGGKAR